jgi:molecular chaperone HtpG
MEIKIPERFENLLRGNKQLQAAVLSSFAGFEPWLSRNSTPFFPEYTDHGPQHIGETIATSSAIIGAEAWAVISPSDIAVLLFAVLLHDCAMHLSEDGFLALVQPGSVRPSIDGFGDLRWSALWVEFLAEASRFDARKLKSLFGQ